MFIFLAFYNQLSGQSFLNHLSLDVKNKIIYYLEAQNQQGSLDDFLNFCDEVITKDSYSIHDKIGIIAYEFITRKKITQVHRFIRLFPISVQEKNKENNNKKLTTPMEYREEIIPIRLYYGNPHYLLIHLKRMKDIIDMYDKLCISNKIEETPFSDAQLQFYIAITNCEINLQKDDLNLLEENKIRRAVANAVTNLFDKYKSRTDEKIKILGYESLLEATYLLIELALKPISESSYDEKISLYRSTIEQFLDRALNENNLPPTKELLDKFTLLDECLKFDEQNSLVGFCLFFSKSHKKDGNLATAAYFVTEAIKFKKIIKNNSFTSNAIMSKLYSEKADIFELADYHQFYNLWIATELRKMAYVLNKNPETKTAYTKTLTSYAEILKKNYKPIFAKDYIQQAISVFEEFPKAHYIAAKIYSDLFYVYEAIRSIILAVTYGVEQKDSETLEYKNLYDELFDFFNKKGLPDPTMDGISTQEIFRTRIEYAKEYNQNLIKTIEKEKNNPQIKKNELLDYEKKLKQIEFNIKSIIEEMREAEFKEKEELKKEMNVLKYQIARLKALISKIIIYEKN